MDNYKPTTEAWVKLPLELLQRAGISKRAAIVLAIIIDRCKHMQNLTTPITIEAITERAGMSRRTIDYAIKELKSLDLIRTQRTGRSSVYTLTPGCVELCPRAVKDDHPAEQQRKPTPRTSKKQCNSSGTDYGAFIKAQEKQFLSMSDEEIAAKYMSGSSSRSFKSDEDEPLPGQQSFFDKGGEAV